MMQYDVIIIGAGPAGLSAALILGRCRRSVLVVDADEPRNGVSRALHGYLTRDGTAPEELRELGRRDVSRYETVRLLTVRVTDAERDSTGFRIVMEDGSSAHASLLLLATGRVDPLPDIPGFRDYYGRGVYHCPYCDGWEHRDQALAIFGSGQGAVDLAEEVLTWSDNVTICTNGGALDERVVDRVQSLGIRVVSDALRRLEGERVLARICFGTERPPLACDALFYCTPCQQRSALPERLGCQFDDEDSVLCTNHHATGVTGLYVAGNVRGGVHLAITAAAEGAEAAILMNEALLERDGARRRQALRKE